MSNHLAVKVHREVSITDWIERKLGLKVNATETKVTPPSKLKYLGFGFWKDKEEWKARPHNDSVQKLKRKLKALCKIDLTHRIKKINEVTIGWINYFRKGSMKNKLHSIDEQGDNLKTVESGEQKAMGTIKARSPRMACTQGCKLG